jgi:hypothetical protein
MDGYAPDASSAVHLCRGLLQLRNRAAGRAGEEKARQHHQPPETEKRFSRPGLLNPIRTNYHYLREVFPRHREISILRISVVTLPKFNRIHIYHFPKTPAWGATLQLKISGNIAFIHYTT